MESDVSAAKSDPARPSRPLKGSIPSRQAKLAPAKASDPYWVRGVVKSGLVGTGFVLLYGFSALFVESALSLGETSDRPQTLVPWGSRLQREHWRLLVGNLWSVGPDASSHLTPPRARGCDLVWCWPVLGALEGSSSQAGEGLRGRSAGPHEPATFPGLPPVSGTGEGKQAWVLSSDSLAA